MTGAEVVPLRMALSEACAPTPVYQLWDGRRGYVLRVGGRDLATADEAREELRRRQAERRAVERLARAEVAS